MELAKMDSKVSDFRIYKRDNNLDARDNLDDIPSEKAVYAISGRINGAPANCRFVGESEDLRRSVKEHFSTTEADSCLRKFMQSIKIKTIDFILLPDSTSDERLQLVSRWKEEYKPDCNDELNVVF
jgi:excinuclease UvrABC nuclease subunit